MHTRRRPEVSSHTIHGSSMKVFSYPAGARSRGTILAVHGFRGDHHGLDLVVQQLADFTIVVPDLPGFGSSTSMNERHDVAGYASALEQLCDQLRLGHETILLGHSFGSLVAAALASGREFSRFIALNPISEPALDSSQALLARLTGLYYEACAQLPSRLGEYLLRSRLVTDLMSAVMTKSRDPQVRDYVKRQHREYFGGFYNRRSLAEAYAASIVHTVQEWSAGIVCPVLLVAGREDELGSPATQELLRDSFEDARLVMLDDVGHLIHYEKPAETAAAISEFLS